MATETRVFYPGEYDSGASSVQSVTNATNPVGKGSTNTTYATINLVTGSSATTTIYWPFDLSAIPSGAEIDSVSCKVKASVSSTSGVSSASVQLYSGSTSKGSSTSILSTSTSAKTLSVGTWTRSELQNCRLCLKAQRGTYSTSTTRSLLFYGADLTVTYTYKNEKFMLKLGGAYNDVARVFKKVNGIWVEQTDLASVIPDNVRYQNGGEYVSPYKTVTITGSGHSSYAYVTINGTKYISPATVSVPIGTVMTCTVSDQYQAYPECYISVDGVKVLENAIGSYNHTVTTSCAVTLVVTQSNGASYGYIAITTQ